MRVKKKTVVLIDDDQDFLEMNRRLLEENGFTVSCFDNTSRAVRMMREQKPDLVVTDLMMTSMDSGFRISAEIKEDPLLGDIPVIIVTAASSRRGFDFKPHSPEELRCINADAYFDKPVSQHEFMAKVRELTEECMENGKNV